MKHGKNFNSKMGHIIANFGLGLEFGGLNAKFENFFLLPPA